MDEETLALIEDMENTILAEAAVRGETARSLAMTLAARYDISLRAGVERAVTRQAAPQPQSQPAEEEIKIAQPSAAQQAMTEEGPANIVKVSELVSGDLSESEREEIMAEVVKEKMNMVESAIPQELQNTIVRPQERSPEADAMSNALFGDGGGNILEEERMLRLAKQQRAMGSGSGGFRRGS
jgi:hypothetical protein